MKSLDVCLRQTDSVKQMAASASVTCARTSASVLDARIATMTSATGSDNGGCR